MIGGETVKYECRRVFDTYPSYGVYKGKMHQWFYAVRYAILPTTSLFIIIDDPGGQMTTISDIWC